MAIVDNASVAVHNDLGQALYTDGTRSTGLGGADALASLLLGVALGNLLGSNATPSVLGANVVPNA